MHGLPPLPDNANRIVHVAICCGPGCIIGVHPHLDLDDARETVVYFLQTVHGLPEDLTWDRWAAMVELGIAPPDTASTSVWSVPLE